MGHRTFRSYESILHTVRPNMYEHCRASLLILVLVLLLENSSGHPIELSVLGDRDEAPLRELACKVRRDGHREMKAVPAADADA